MPTFKDAEEILAKNKEKGTMSWHDMSMFIQNVLVGDNGYIIDTGSGYRVNYICAEKLLQKIKKHPRFWKWFFMLF